MNGGTPEVAECVECSEERPCVWLGQDAPFQRVAVCGACLEKALAELVGAVGDAKAKADALELSAAMDRANHAAARSLTARKERFEREHDEALTKLAGARSDG